ncbi:MAG: LacI family transcriptional regulator [Nocardioidaceae bacterium]|nr:LacI family transcriptional regulator [Nocardioidaceae bacterium]
MSEHIGADLTGSRVATATLTTVAQLAGVSRQTVSNALNNPDLLRPDTLARVLQVIEQVGYTPNRAARQLRSGESHLIGLRFEPAQEGTTNALMDRFLHTLVDTTRKTGHHVLLFSGKPTDPLDGYDELLRQTAVDAFVITDTYTGTPQAAWLQERGAPFVAFGRPWDDPAPSYPWVDVDGSAGASLATRHLLELGHEKIAWLGWERSSRIGEDRRTGWSAAMNRASRPTDGLGLRLTDNADAARMAAHDLISAGVLAFVCASDTMGLGVLRAFEERHMVAGVDGAVVGFDDSAAAQVTGLSSVRQPLEEVAVEVVRLLRGALAGEPSPTLGTVLTPKLAVRASSVRPAFQAQ